MNIAVDVLEAMDECMVARKSANIIRHMLAQVKGESALVSKTTDFDRNIGTAQLDLGHDIVEADNEVSGAPLTEDLDFVRLSCPSRRRCRVQSLLREASLTT